MNYLHNYHIVTDTSRNQRAKIWADGAYKGEEFVQWVKEKFDCIFGVVEKIKALWFLPVLVTI